MARTRKLKAVLIGLLFAFAGSSAVGFMHKLDKESRSDAATALMSLSIACLIGLHAGIFVGLSMRSENLKFTSAINLTGQKERSHLTVYDKEM